jgi:hypothetical protein
MIIIKVYPDWVGTTHFNSDEDSLKLKIFKWCEFMLFYILNDMKNTKY